MSTENDQARDVIDSSKFTGIPIPIWQSLFKYVIGPIVAAIIGLYVGHENGKAATPDNQVGLNQVYGEIKTPGGGETVGNAKGEFECTGKAEGLTRGLHLWLAVEKNGYIWPKADGFVPDKGIWKKTISQNGKPTDDFGVTLFVANDEANNAINEWFRVGKETNNWAQLEWIRGINRLDRVDRLRLNPQH